MIDLIAPESSGRSTGGFLVNRLLAASAGFSLAEVSSPNELQAAARAPGQGPALIDTLYLFDSAYEESIGLLCASRPVFLMGHSLPSLIAGPDVGWRRAALNRERRILPLLAGAIAPSEFMAQALSRRGARPTRVVSLAPVCDGRSVGAGDGPSDRDARDRGAGVSILTVANWSGAKGVLTAAKALSEMTDLEWHWTIVGNRDPLAAEARAVSQVLDTSLAGRVTVAGSVPTESLASYYRMADLFLLLSSMESYGIAYAEAISFGTPVAAYRMAGVPEVVGDAGIYCRAGTESKTLRLTIESMTGLTRGVDLASLTERVELRRAELPTWPQQAAAVRAAISSLTGEGSAA